MTQSIVSNNNQIESREPASPYLSMLARWARSSWSFLGATWNTLARQVDRQLDVNPTRPLNIERIAAMLSIDDRARKDAENELPPSHEERAGGTQREIIHYFRELQRKAYAKAAARREKLYELGENIDIAETRSRLREILPGCESEIRRLLAEARSELDLLEGIALRQCEHYDSFRERNDLQRVAAPGRPWLLSMTLVLGLIVAGAAAINYLAPADASGLLLGKEIFALVVSCVIVAVAYGIGASAFRSVNHVDASANLYGLLSGLFVLVFIAATAFSVAHYFAALSIDPQVTLQTVFNQALADPTSIGIDRLDIGAIALIGLLAFLAGYESDDRYPGYGAVQRAFYKARNAREHAFARLRKRINEEVDSRIDAIAEIALSQKVKLKQYARLINDATHDPEVLGSFDLALEDSCNILLDRYRACNRAVRTTDQPGSFAEHISFRSEGGAVTATPIERHEHKLKKLRDGSAEMDDEAVRLKQGLQDLNRQAVGALESHVEIVPHMED